MFGAEYMPKQLHARARQRIDVEAHPFPYESCRGGSQPNFDSPNVRNRLEICFTAALLLTAERRILTVANYEYIV